MTELDWQGDHVDEFQPLCEVQSDKATMEITSRYKGKVSQILHVPGNIVKVLLFNKLIQNVNYFLKFRNFATYCFPFIFLYAYVYVNF